jgi:hypothetical protein
MWLMVDDLLCMPWIQCQQLLTVTVDLMPEASRYEESITSLQ